MDNFVTVLVAVIGAIGVSAGPIGVVLIQRGRKEQKDFRVENDRQHGNSMKIIKEIELTTRETAIELRELRQDLEDHLDEHVDGALEGERTY